MIGGHFLKAWSKTQQAVTTSSAEAELVAMNKCAQEMLGILSMFADLGEDSQHGACGAKGGLPWLTGVVCGDSSAALAISDRQGCGKLRHIKVGELWIQEQVRNKAFSTKKVDGHANPADMFTKHLAGDRIIAYCMMISLLMRSGRARSGLNVQHGNSSNSKAVAV